MKGFIKDMWVWLLAILILIAIFWVAAYAILSSSCDNQWVDFTHRFETWGGCMVQYEGTWYPADVMRQVIEP